MKKTIIVLLFIIILLPGCLDNLDDDSKSPRAKSENLELSIEMEKKTINLNSSSIIILVILRNIEKYNIEISKYFTLASNIFLNITTPEGTHLEYSDIFASPLEEYEEIAPNGAIEKSFDIKNVTWKLNDQLYDWTIIGKYSIIAEYAGVYPHVYSNQIEFEITSQD